MTITITKKVRILGIWFTYKTTTLIPYPEA